MFLLIKFAELKFFFMVIILLISYYFLMYIFFLNNNQIPNYPILKTRLGTVFWSLNYQPKEADFTWHTYCYYPKNSNYIWGESYFKKVSDIYECSDWYGIWGIFENKDFSEKEMMNK